MADITANLDDCDLKAADVAQRQRVTTPAAFPRDRFLSEP